MNETGMNCPSEAVLSHLRTQEEHTKTAYLSEYFDLYISRGNSQQLHLPEVNESGVNATNFLSNAGSHLETNGVNSE